jgi:hypothetical protein
MKRREREERATLAEIGGEARVFRWEETDAKWGRVRVDLGGSILFVSKLAHLLLDEAGADPTHQHFNHASIN